MEFKIPHAMNVEHEELHERLTRVIGAGGQTGAAGQAVAEALHAHFGSEEAFALPPLGLLPALAAGQVSPEMAPVLEMTERLKSEMPRMLAEHQAIVAALDRLVAAAQREGQADAVRFAEQLRLHARNEEEVSYPAAILIGEYLKLKLGR